MIDLNDFIFQPLEQRRQLLEEALAALGDRDSELRALLLFRKAYAYRWDDRVREAAASEARAIAERDGLTAVLARLTMVEIGPLIRDAARTEIEQRCEQAWRSAEAAADLYLAAATRRVLATVMRLLGDLDASERHATAAIEYANRIRYAQEVANAARVVASLRTLRGDLAALDDPSQVPSSSPFDAIATAHYRHVRGDTTAVRRLPEQPLGLTGTEFESALCGVAASHAAATGDEAATRVMLVRRAELVAGVGRMWQTCGDLSGAIWMLLDREEL